MIGAGAGRVPADKSGDKNGQIQGTRYRFHDGQCPRDLGHGRDVPKAERRKSTEAEIKGIETTHMPFGMLSQRELESIGRELGEQHISLRPE